MSFDLQLAANSDHQKTEINHQTDALLPNYLKIGDSTNEEEIKKILQVWVLSSGMGKRTIRLARKTAKRKKSKRVSTRHAVSELVDFILLALQKGRFQLSIVTAGEDSYVRIVPSKKEKVRTPLGPINEYEEKSNES